LAENREGNNTGKSETQAELEIISNIHKRSFSQGSLS